MSRAINLILHLTLIPATVHTLIAQNYRANAHRYSIEDGLPHRQVNAVIQDRRGLIWKATPAGVERFDGYRFSV